MKTFLLLFRKLSKNKSATLLGTAGLIVGLVCVVYIFLLVTDEISYDRFHKKINNIFVVHAYLEGGTEKVNFNGCPPLVTSWETDEDMLKTFGAKMAEGNFFDRDQKGIVINKTFADIIGWDSFEGKSLVNDDSQYRVLGVINDIRFNSLSAATQPMAIEMISNSLINYME